MNNAARRTPHAAPVRTMKNLLRALAVIPFATSLVYTVEAGNDPQTPSGPDKKEEDFLKSLKVPEGMSPAVWAKDQQILNAIAIDVDEKGRVFTSETFRWRKGGVIDVRNFMFLYKDDLQVKTSADRLAMIEKWKDKFPADFFTKESERIRVIEDTDGDGKADKVTTFAEDFRDPVDGPAAGILVQNNRVYFTNIPKIWGFDDKNDDLKADNREVLSDGWGPRFSISGHDLHGLAMGPDGRIYVSLGDRGYNVKSKEGNTFTNTISGGVFRFDPDGSNLEQYYLDLRNPQELAFDSYGNLFTVDNNADIGDAARVVYILEGGSSAWSHGWQLLGNDGFAKAAGLDGRQANPWLEEGLWKSAFPEQPAWVLPAVGHITSGPSGLAFYPGVGFGDRLKDTFLVCDYRAGTDSGVWSFKLNEKGAGYELPDNQKEKFCWGLPPTDVVFGYDGRAYISDYIGGWELNNHGRVVTVSDTTTRDSVASKELKSLMAQGFTKRSPAELGKLLGYADMRARQHAQFELVARGKEGQAVLSEAAAKGASTFARLHGIWGLWQLARKDATITRQIEALLADSDARVREQAAKVLGDLKVAAAAPALVKLLADSNARVQSFAAIALGRIKHPAATPELLRVLKDNDNKDVYLRHAAVMGLLGCSDAKALAALNKDASAGVRMGAILALRRLKDAGLAGFLDDATPVIRAEAMRAIYDGPVAEAMPALIAQLAKPIDGAIPEPIARLLYLRLINAAQRWGDESAAKILVDFAAAQKAPTDVRAVALKALESWEKSTWIDPVIGYPRKALRREKGPDPAPLKDGIMAIVAHNEDRLMASAVKLAQRFGYGLSDEVLLKLVDNAGMASDVRAEALTLLTEHKAAGLASRLPNLLKEDNGEIRRAAFTALIAIDRKAAITAGITALNQEGSTQPELMAVAEKTDGPWSTLPLGEPTADNLATKGTVTWLDSFSVPYKDAGAEGDKLPRLHDGKLAANDDDTKASTWFEQHEARWILDLGKAVELGRVDTYAWHKANRAPMEFTLWAANGDKRPDATVVNPSAGWVKLADASSVKLGEGGKHGVAVVNATGTLGTYRWLMWQSKRKGTFFCEVAAYAAGQAPTGLTRVVTDKEGGAWEMLSMGGPDAAGVAVKGVVATSVEGFAKPADGANDGGKLPRLFSKDVQANDDDAAHSVWADNGEARWLVDLQKPVEIARINTYSWHKAERAPQQFVLWASSADKAPDAATKDLTGAGWRRIAAVDTKALGDGGKHGSSVLGLGGAISARWLLWQHAERKAGTFVGRIDVFPAGVELPPIKRPLSPATIALKQHVLASFGALDDAQSAAVLSEWLDRLAAGKATGAVQLELVTAAGARKEPAIASKLKAWRDSLDAKDPLANYRTSLHGGDVTKGRQVFQFHLAQCIKCHSVNHEGGNAGPDLAGVGKRLSQEKILESLITPSAVVVPGFGLATVTQKDGSSVAGSLLKNDDKGAVVKLADGKEVTIAKDKIDKITPPMSPMPPVGVILSATELRDVMAYLASLK
jgi:quinoprotein glucose dehydrogenase